MLVRGISGADHQSLSPCKSFNPNIDPSVGRCKSPSISSVLDPEYLASVTARFAATNDLPSLITLLVTLQ